MILWICDTRQETAVAVELPLDIFQKHENTPPKYLDYMHINPFKQIWSMQRTLDPSRQLCISSSSPSRTVRTLKTHRAAAPPFMKWRAIRDSRRACTSRPDLCGVEPLLSRKNINKVNAAQEATNTLDAVKPLLVPISDKR
jgi:hypothetical protein